jgi:hypothetical protein
MDLWSRNNYGHIARLVHLPLEGPPKDRNIGPIARDLRALLDGKSLVAFEILELQDQAAAATNARVLVRYRQDEEISEQELKLRLLYLDEEGNSVVRGKGRGNWMVLNLWTLI